MESNPTGPEQPGAPNVGWSKMPSITVELSEFIEKAYAAGQEAWPEVRLDPAAFAERLQGLALDAQSLAARAGDIYLAAACLTGDKAALLAFERTFLVPVPKMLTRVGLSPHQEDELRQQLRIRLLVGPCPRIGEYKGLGPLGAWVRVCALRLALALKTGGEAKRNDSDAVDELMADFSGNEMVLDTQQHGPAFKAALQEALAGLAPREKTLLRLHFLEGMNIDALGAVFRVHRATAARWLVAIRTQILGQVRAKLSLEIGASQSEAVSLVRLLRSEVQVSIRRILSEESSRS